MWRTRRCWPSFWVSSSKQTFPWDVQCNRQEVGSIWLCDIVKSSRLLRNSLLLHSQSVSLSNSVFSAQGTCCSTSSSCLHNSIPYGMITSQGPSSEMPLPFFYPQNDPTRKPLNVFCKTHAMMMWKWTNHKVIVTLDHMCVYTRAKILLTLSKPTISHLEWTYHFIVQ